MTELLVPLLTLGAVLVCTVGGALAAPARLAAALAVVFLFPGLLALQAAEGLASLRVLVLDRLPRAFGLTFVALTVLTVAGTELRLSSSTAAHVVVAANVLLAAAALRARGITVEPRATPRRLEWLLVVALGILVLLLARAGGLYGAIPDGEEALHLTFIRKLHGNAAISRDAIMYRPDVPSTYIYLPYHLALAMVARLARVDPFAAYMKARGLWALLAITATGGLAAAFGASRRATRVVTVLCLILALNGRAGPWWGPFARLLPYSHHADFSLGVLLPVALLACGRFVSGQASRYERIATPALLFATAIAHTREGIQLLFYLIALAAGLLALRGTKPVLRRVAVLALLVTGFGLGYARLHQGAVGHIQDWERAERAAARDLWKGFAHSPVDAVAGVPLAYRDTSPNYLTNFHSLFHPYVLLGATLAPVLLLRRRSLVELAPFTAMAGTLAVAVVPVLSVAMVLATYSQVLFTPARYVIHFGYMVLGLTALAAANAAERLRRALPGTTQTLAAEVASGSTSRTLTLRLGTVTPARAAVVAAAGALLAGAGLVASASLLDALAGANRIGTARALLGLSLLAAALMALLRTRLQTPRPEPDRHGPAWGLLLALVLMPVALWREVDRDDLLLIAQTPVEAAAIAAGHPDVLEERAWYEDRRPLPIPFDLLTQLRHLPAGVVAADPKWMGMLPAFANQYVFSAGQYLSTEQPLVEAWARWHGLELPADTPQQELRRVYLRRMRPDFPIFNDVDPPEITAYFLRAWNVRYVVSPVTPPRALAAAMARWPSAFRVRIPLAGWIVYETDLSQLP